MVPKLEYLNYISCGLAHEMVACFNNLCLIEKQAKTLPHMDTVSNMAAPLL